MYTIYCDHVQPHPLSHSNTSKPTLAWWEVTAVMLGTVCWSVAVRSRIRLQLRSLYVFVSTTSCCSHHQGKTLTWRRCCTSSRSPVCLRENQSERSRSLHGHEQLQRHKPPANILKWPGVWVTSTMLPSLCRICFRLDCSTFHRACAWHTAQIGLSIFSKS